MKSLSEKFDDWCRKEAAPVEPIEEKWFDRAFDDSRWVTQSATVGSVLELFIFLGAYIGIIFIGARLLF